MFSRIRKCDADGDVSRTRRQRMVITALIEAAKNIKVSQIDDLLSTLLPSVSTSFSRLDFIKYGTQAITYNWMSYPIEQLQMPNEANRTSATINGIWYWISDFPVCARDLQLAIYGKTNIELDENEDTVMDFFYTLPTTSASSGNDVTEEAPSEDAMPTETQPAELTEPSMTSEPAESESAETPSSEPSTQAPTEGAGDNDDAQPLD